MGIRMSEEEYKAYLERRNGDETSSARLRRPPSPEGKASEDATNTRAEKRNKYGNRRVEIDGMKFDSQHEADVYQALRLRVMAGELKTVCRQVRFDLPGGIQYIADFVTLTPDMRIDGVYDAKSEITKKNRVYINKKKQMKALWGIEIKEV